MIDIEHLRQWIGKRTIETGYAAEAPLLGLAATLDYSSWPWPAGEVPPLGHWLYFLPTAPQSGLGEDGHPRRGGFLPPVPLPRRMWAGGQLRFDAPLRLGTAIRRRSTVTDVTLKSGSTGDMVFVAVTHEILDHEGRVYVEERHDIVYRGAAGEAPAAAQPPQTLAPGDPAAGNIRRTVLPDPVMLFRYSALTFNGHRIHYDRDYARDREGYPGLVVHGPLQATLLLDHFLRETPGARAASFEFRARRPLFDGAPVMLHLNPGADKSDLWTSGPDGLPAMTASVRTAR